MPRARSTVTIQPKVWITPAYGALYKIEVVRSDGTLDDITDIIYNGQIVDGVTNMIGDFNFTIDNSGESYTGKWTGNEIVNIYMDYATEATTKVFRGRIEKVSPQNNVIKIIGRSESKQLLDVTVTKSYENQETSSILTDLFDTYASEFTYSNVSVSSTNVTVNWYQKSFLECVNELCNVAGFDFYVDSSLDAHYFESGSINNQTEAVVHDSNLLDVGEFAYDQSLIKNRVIVYGDQIEGLDIIATSEDTSSQTTYGIKELIVNDKNIKTQTQAQERADYELNLYKNPPLTGEVTSVGLATIQPGEKVRISAPQSNLQPTYYKIVKYRHEFGGFMKTTLTIEKEPKKIYHVIRDRIGQEQKLSDMPNPNEMRYSWIESFDSDSGSHTNTQITSGVLKTDGSSTGTWISDTKALSSNASSIEIRVSGNNLSGVTYEISADAGVNWQTVSGTNSIKALSPPGIALRLKITFNSSNTEINAVNVLYK